jgi:hypothetical protein
MTVISDGFVMEQKPTGDKIFSYRDLAENLYQW